MGLTIDGAGLDETYLEDAAETTDELAEGDAPTTFEVHGRTYEIALTKKRIDLYEQRHKPIMSTFIQNEGGFSLSELTSLLAYGLRVEGGPFVNPRRGTEMAERLLEESGYLAVYEAVMSALQRDCGFLFQGV